MLYNITTLYESSVSLLTIKAKNFISDFANQKQMFFSSKCIINAKIYAKVFNIMCNHANG